MKPTQNTYLVVAPTIEPVTAAEVKLHTRIDGSAEDSLLALYISAAREQCEHLIGRAIMPQTWELVLDEFPTDNDIVLLHPPIQGIVSIKYISAVTALQVTLPSNQYTLDKNSEPGWVSPAYGVAWPDTLNIASAVRVQYVCGYADAASVPSSIKQWIMMAVAFLYQNRETTILPEGYQIGLLDRHKVWSL